MESKYTCEYDEGHRVRSAEHEIFGNFPVTGAYNTSYSYDLAGNIETLVRRGRIDNTLLPNTAVYEEIDNLT